MTYFQRSLIDITIVASIFQKESLCLMKTRHIDIEILCICSLSIGAEALMVKENLTLNVGGKCLMNHQYTPGARKKSR